MSVLQSIHCLICSRSALMLVTQLAARLHQDIHLICKISIPLMTWKNCSMEEGFSMPLLLIWWWNIFSVSVTDWLKSFSLKLLHMSNSTTKSVRDIHCASKKNRFWSMSAEMSRLFQDVFSLDRHYHGQHDWLISNKNDDWHMQLDQSEITTILHIWKHRKNALDSHTTVHHDVGPQK